MIKVPKYAWAIASLIIVGDERGGDVQLAARQTSGTNSMKRNTCNGELALFDSLKIGSAGILSRLDFMVSRVRELIVQGVYVNCFFWDCLLQGGLRGLLVPPRWSRQVTLRNRVGETTLNLNI